MVRHIIQAVFFDFGGVLAEEGFRNGLHAIATANRLDGDRFFETARDAIASCGYLTGRATEADYFDLLRASTGITQADDELRRIILDGFILRDWMLSLVKRLSARGVRVAVLSDQTNWLDELDGRLHFFSLFERVYNSFHIGKSKTDPSLFADVLADMGLSAHHALFIDDTQGHVARARSLGMHAIHFRGRDEFLAEMNGFFPDLVGTP